MFVRSLKLSRFGGLASAALLAKKKQQEEGSVVEVRYKDQEEVRNTPTLSRVFYNSAGPHSVPQETISSINDLLGDGQRDDVFEELCDEDVDNTEEDTKVVNTSVLDLAGEVIRPNEQGRQQAQSEKLKAAVTKARDLCWTKMYESGTPGMVVGIAVNGKSVWQHGFGYSDLENKLLAGTGCIMRVASISKPLTMAVLAKLWEEGRVDMEESVHKYVPDWPRKIVDGVEVDITVRQLASHLGGVRHYQRKGETDPKTEDREFLLQQKFASTSQSVDLFREDELLSTPGTEFHYSTHGFTLLARIIESVTDQPFDKYMEAQFKELGLSNTYLDRHGPLIYNRAKYYVRDEQHRLRNAPYVDNSYKWAGGGFLSSVGDLVKFGNAMLYSYQQKQGPPSSVPPEAPAPSPGGLPVPPEAPAPSTGKKDEMPDQGTVPPPPDTTPPPVEPEADADSNPETEQLKTSMKKSSENIDTSSTIDETESKHELEEVVYEPGQVGYLQDVVYEPGPYASVNKRPPQNQKRYLPGFLKSSTMAEIWKPQVGAEMKWGGDDLIYGLGWAVRPRVKNYGFCKDNPFYACHTGGACGASSVLLICPHNVVGGDKGGPLPRGVVVSILVNMEGVGLSKLASDIARVFEGLELEKPVKVQKVYQC